MERGDIAAYSKPGLAVMFEGVLANPPDRFNKIIANVRLRANDYDSYLSYWKPNHLQVKHVVDSINRKQIGVLVYTLLPPELSTAVDRWLLHRNISTTIMVYQNVDDLVESQQFMQEIKSVFVNDDELAKRIGIRATVIQPDTKWNI